MDSQSNYSPSGAPKVFNERFGIVPNLSANPSSRFQKNKIRFIFIGSLIAILIVSTIIFFLFFQKGSIGSGNKEDLIKFVKLYQYGDANSKKDINLNMPSNYTYAYKMLNDSYTGEERSQYADFLHSLYIKYNNKGNLFELTLLYKSYLQLPQTISKIGNLYFDKDEESSNKFIKQSVYSNMVFSSDFIKQSFSDLEKYLNSYMLYLKELNKEGCIKDKKIDQDCENRLNQDTAIYPDFDAIQSEMNAFESSILEKYTDFFNYMDNVVRRSYEENILSKEAAK